MDWLEQIKKLNPDKDEIKEEMVGHVDFEKKIHISS